MRTLWKIVKKVLLSILMFIAFLFGIASAIGMFRLITCALNYLFSIHF